jgi:hypothetical protein
MSVLSNVPPPRPQAPEPAIEMLGISLVLSVTCRPANKRREAADQLRTELTALSHMSDTDCARVLSYLSGYVSARLMEECYLREEDSSD